MLHGLCVNRLECGVACDDVVAWAAGLKVALVVALFVALVVALDVVLGVAFEVGDWAANCDGRWLSCMWW